MKTQEILLDQIDTFEITSILIRACGQGRLKFVKTFFTPRRRWRKIDLDFAFIRAVETGHKSIVILLRLWGAGNDLQGERSLTKALESAIYFGNEHIAKLLCDWGADLDSGLRAASWRGNIRMVRYFIKMGATDYKGAFIEAASSGKIRTMRFLSEQITEDEPYDSYSRALTEAIECGKIRAVKWILTGFSREIADSCLETAARCGRITIMEILRYHVSKYHFSGNFHAQVLNDAFVTAANAGHQKVLTLLKEWGATDLQTAYGRALGHEKIEAAALIRSWM